MAKKKPAKPKVAFYWCASCGGCEEAVVDLAEDLLDVASKIEIVLWPVALDFKRKDVEALDDGAIAVSFINGAVRLSEQEEMVRLLRRKSKLVVAFGSCAHLGGIPGLANFSSAPEVLRYVYQDLPSVDNPEGTLPQGAVETPHGTLTLPAFHDTVKTLDQVVEVDYFLPGCAPPPDLVLGAIEAILAGNLPEKGTVLSPNMALCDECPRRDSKPEVLEITEIKRVSTATPDPERCFLADGFVCMGPATRSGCGHRCIEANMPCRGCFGPLDGVADHGAKFLSAFASLLKGDDEESLARLAETLPDPAGTFYRFSLPASLLRRRKMEEAP